MNEDIAKRMHEAYERLAPGYGYETRKASRVPWDQLPMSHRRLMEDAVTEATKPLCEVNTKLRAALERVPCTCLLLADVRELKLVHRCPRCEVLLHGEEEK